MGPRINFEKKVEFDINEMIIDIILVTPDIAREYLEKNTGNFRPMKPELVKDYKGIMQKGQWTFSDSVIAFNNKGIMVNGQHRCKAIIESGVSTYNLVVWKFPDHYSIDNHSKRTMADHLRHEGVPNPTLAASGLRLVYDFKKNGVKKFSGYIGGKTGASNKEMIDLYYSIPNYDKSVKIGGRKSKMKLAPPSFICGLHSIWSQDDEEAADKFMEAFQLGFGLDRNDPIYMLRERLLRNAETQTRKLEKRVILALIIKAWNLFVTGGSVKKLQWQPAREPFPTMIFPSDIE